MKKQEIKTLKSFHATLAALSVLGLLAVIFIENWGEMTMWLPMAAAVCFDGKYEKTDELARLNLSKANTITMWVLFAALCWFAMYARFHAVPVSHFVVVLCGVLAFRSILFLILDRTPKADESEDANA